MKLAVTADIHADDLGQKIDPATGQNARFLDAINVTRWIAQDAKERGCDGLLVMGDFCENRHPAPWRVAMIRDALAVYGGPYVLTRGNHDGSRGGRSIVDLLAEALPNAQGFSDRPGIAWLGTTAIVCVPHLDRHYLRAEPGFEHTPDSEIFAVLAEQYLTIARGLLIEAQDKGAKTILFAGHQTASGGQMSETQQAFLGDQALVVDAQAIAAAGYDAVLFGHLHRQQVLSADPLIAYPGSPLRTDFGEEREVKSYMVIDTDRLPAFELIETPARRFVTIKGTIVPDGSVQPEINGAIVRCIDVPPEADVAGDRRVLEELGAFEVAEIRKRPVVIPELAGGLSEAMSPSDALSAFFEGDSDAPALIEEGRRLLAEVAA